MKSFGISLVAAAAVSLSLVSPAAGSSSGHAANLAAHKRRFNRVHRSPTGTEDAMSSTGEQAVIDVDMSAGELVVRNATATAAQEGLQESGNHLSKRGYNGRATFFQPGLGACGTWSNSGDFVSGSRRRSDRLREGRRLTDLGARSQMVALNEAQYGDLGAVSSWCFQTITISYGPSVGLWWEARMRKADLVFCGSQAARPRRLRFLTREYHSRWLACIRT